MLISIVFTAQTTNDSITCLETKKVDFLIEWHLRAKSLMNDTMIAEQEIKGLDAIIRYKDDQISGMGHELDLKDTIISKNHAYILKLYKQSENKDRKIKLFKNTTVIFGSISLILLGLFFITK